jgi:hypothetical protein
VEGLSQSAGRYVELRELNYLLRGEVRELPVSFTAALGTRKDGGLYQDDRCSVSSQLHGFEQCAP